VLRRVDTYDSPEESVNCLAQFV